MHVLRPIAVAAAVAATAGLLGGCAAFDKAAAVPERIPPHPLAVYMQDDIRYLVSNASDADVARLEQCLNRFPSVMGVNVETPDGS